MLDTYGRKINYLRLSVTEKCNLRCRYCMPEEGIAKRRHEDMLTEDEMINAVRAAAQLGISKLRITGGEPLVKKNILSICARAAAVEGIEELCITTNGTLLSGMAGQLRAAGVSRVNISLDTLDPEKFAHITRRDMFHQAMEGIESALAADFERVKINAVLIGGFNDDELDALAALTLRHRLDLRFIEFMPMPGSADFGPEAMTECSAILKALPQLQALDASDGVAKLYRLPGAKGNIGLISPVSSHFCDRCNRIRLTADGMLKPCLHSAEEYPIKGLDYQGTLEQFKRAILSKPPRHQGLSCGKTSGAERGMNAIGG